MERYDQLYRLYDEFDTATLRAYQTVVDLFPPIDSRVALEYWEDASGELDARKDAVRAAFPDAGATLAEVAARATREQAFAALDLASKYGRGVNVLVVDIDETLRSAGRTDNEIPRETLHLLTELHGDGVPLVISTGQTLENVKGFLIQGLGNRLAFSGTVAIVYEAGAGAFAPGHGADTKQLLYERLDDDVRAIFDEVRTRVLRAAPDDLRRDFHLQGNEFNVTLKPNAEVGSAEARDVIVAALCHLLDLLGAAVAAAAGIDDDEPGRWARAHYAAADVEVRRAIEGAGALPDVDPEQVPTAAGELFDAVDVGYYEADAVEITGRDLDKAAGVEAALSVLGVDDPFALVLGDSRSDLRVMEWAAEGDRGIAAAPDHASRTVLDHVIRTDELIFDRGKAGDILRIAYALNRLEALA